jgi:hypothetical protein
MLKSVGIRAFPLAGTFAFEALQNILKKNHKFANNPALTL